MGEILAKNVLTATPSTAASHDSNAAARKWDLKGGAALAIFHQRIFDEWASGSLNEPLARIKVDEKKVLWDN